MTEGSIPSGSYSDNLSEVCEDIKAMSVVQGANQGHSQPVDRQRLTPAEIGRKRTQAFLDQVFEARPKSRRLEVASKIKELETLYGRTGNRIRKARQRMSDLARALKNEETKLAELDQQIRGLKAEEFREEFE